MIVKTKIIENNSNKSMLEETEGNATRFILIDL